MLQDVNVGNDMETTNRLQLQWQSIDRELYL